jgi:hypothetical protein
VLGSRIALYPDDVVTLHETKSVFRSSFLRSSARDTDARRAVVLLT